MPSMNTDLPIRSGLILGRVLMGIAILGAGLTITGYFVASRPSIDASYDPTPLLGRWTFREPARSRTTHPIFTDFQRDWGRPNGNETQVKAGAWKARMTALTRLARLGPEILPLLLQGMDDRDSEVRELAAQAMGCLGDRSVVSRLDRAICEDPSSTVRIYSAIARGSIAGDLPQGLVQAILKGDPSPMVRARLELAQTRGNSPGFPSVRELFAAYDLNRMDTARVGELAPDFSLNDLDGVTHRLSDYRGQKDVVLVFVYGVTCFYCTGHASNMRNKIAEFDAAGVQVLLVEANEPYRVAATSKESKLETSDPRLKLLLDPAHVAAATYGVAMQMNHIEWLNRPATFLIDRRGVIRKSWISRHVSDRPTPEVLLDEVKHQRQAAVASPSISPLGRKHLLGQEPGTE